MTLPKVGDLIRFCFSGVSEFGIVTRLGKYPDGGIKSGLVTARLQKELERYTRHRRLPKRNIALQDTSQ